MSREAEPKPRPKSASGKIVALSAFAIFLVAAMIYIQWAKGGTTEELGRAIARSVYSQIRANTPLAQMTLDDIVVKNIVVEEVDKHLEYRADIEIKRTGFLPKIGSKAPLLQPTGKYVSQVKGACKISQLPFAGPVPNVTRPQWTSTANPEVSPTVELNTDPHGMEAYWFNGSGDPANLIFDAWVDNLNSGWFYRSGEEWALIGARSFRRAGKFDQARAWLMDSGYLEGGGGGKWGRRAAYELRFIESKSRI